MEERDRKPIEASWCARTSSRRTSKEDMCLGEAPGLSSSGKISTNLEGILLFYREFIQCVLIVVCCVES